MLADNARKSMSGGDGCEALPPYTVRASDRARRVRLTVSAQEGLVVVVPRRWRGDPDKIVAASAEWANAALGRVAPRRAEFLSGPAGVLPDEVFLRAIARTYPVTYVPGERARAGDRAGALVVAPSQDPDAALAALHRWLSAEARGHLGARLAELSSLHGVAYRRWRLTTAKSRWGSCSAKGTVSLHRNLMFLSPELVDSVILHELAHLRVMDHSARFYGHLATMDPDARSHRSRLKGASNEIPVWAEYRICR